jgi:2-dehydro-3-deoxygluconokinase
MRTAIKSKPKNTIISEKLISRPIDILSLGSLTLEIIVRIEKWPAYGGQHVVNVSSLDYTAGGCGVNVCCFAGRLGAKTRIISPIGTGRHGQEVLEELKSSHVETGSLKFYKNKVGNAIIITTIPNGDWSVMESIDPSMFLEVRDLPAQTLFKKAKIFHVDGFSFITVAHKETVSAAIDKAKAAGCLVSIDASVPAVDEDLEYLRQIFHKGDIVFGNLYECLAVSDTKNINQAIKAFQKMGPKLCVIKKGDKGSTVITPERTFDVPPFIVEVVDTVAAGDAYIATTLYRLLQGDNLYDACLHGSAAGALACLGPGSLSSHFNMADINKLIKSAG